MNTKSISLELTYPRNLFPSPRISPRPLAVDDAHILHHLRISTYWNCSPHCSFPKYDYTAISVHYDCRDAILMNRLTVLRARSPLAKRTEYHFVYGEPCA